MISLLKNDAVHMARWDKVPRSLQVQKAILEVYGKLNELCESINDLKFDIELLQKASLETARKVKGDQPKNGYSGKFKSFVKMKGERHDK